MLKKTVTYANFDGVEVTEDHYFNLTKAELMKMQLSEDEGFKEHLEKIVASGKGKDIIDAFEQILRLSYGVRTTDGKFIKSAEAFNAFLATEAYSDLFFELVTDAKKSAEFVNAIIPAGMVEEVQKAQGLNTNTVVVDEARSVQDVTPDNMTEDELRAALGAPKERVTGGYTDSEIRMLTPMELSTKPREILLRAYQLKSQ